MQPVGRCRELGRINLDPFGSFWDGDIVKTDRHLFYPSTSEKGNSEASFKVYLYPSCQRSLELVSMSIYYITV